VWGWAGRGRGRKGRVRGREGGGKGKDRKGMDGWMSDMWIQREEREGGREGEREEGTCECKKARPSRICRSHRLTIRQRRTGMGCTKA